MLFEVRGIDHDDFLVLANCERLVTLLIETLRTNANAISHGLVTRDLKGRAISRMTSARAFKGSR